MEKQQPTGSTAYQHHQKCSWKEAIATLKLIPYTPPLNATKSSFDEKAISKWIQKADGSNEEKGDGPIYGIIPLAIDAVSNWYSRTW
jgi:hypothetical protein